MFFHIQVWLPAGSISNRKVLEILKQRNGKRLKGLILEAIEGLAVKHQLVRESTNIHDWSDEDQVCGNSPKVRNIIAYGETIGLTNIHHTQLPEREQHLIFCLNALFGAEKQL